jgi:hypothetical protein
VVCRRGILARGHGLKVGRDFVRGLGNEGMVHGCTKCMCVHWLTQDGKILGFGQSTLPFPFFLRCKQHSLLYTYLNRMNTIKLYMQFCTAST